MSLLPLPAASCQLHKHNKSKNDKSKQWKKKKRTILMISVTTWGRGRCGGLATEDMLRPRGIRRNGGMTKRSDPPGRWCHHLLLEEGDYSC